MQPDILKNSLIVSCQPVPGGPMDEPVFVAGFAMAAVAAGATALRIESARYVRAVRPKVDVPIIGIVKRDLEDSPVRITPFLSDVEDLAAAGADIIAIDATSRPRPVALADLVVAARAHGKLTMADCSSLEDARHALECGMDFVGTTLSGYVGGPEPEDPDIALITEMAALTPYVIAEGRIRTPQQAADAARAGAFAVTVGSAITRTEHTTAWFRDALADAYRADDDRAVLAIDIGGTKSMAALVSDGRLIERVQAPTAAGGTPDGWLAAIHAATRDWHGRYGSVGIAATGLVEQGLWQALNPATLDIPGRYPLKQQAESLFGAPVLAVNDAQAAAWGEYLATGKTTGSIVFLTISTGIGGGVVSNGALMTGLAGHFGLTRSASGGAAPLEDRVSGKFIAAEAARLGHDQDTPAVFRAAANGEEWAADIVDGSAAKVASLCADIKLMFDPDTIVIGGGIGLADGFLGRVTKHFAALPPRLRPELKAARCGAEAGLIGVADLARAAAAKGKCTT
ncbi:putative N-acetylmannosamine-6-phosphate 2-epimerase [Martelella soudanensis]|uniref:putative N-acetylmannosamine-6-phosphate 2-epimerase n=1 Tax=unclassified Martelella TaxID=2629616 RepID=UPI001AEF29D8|nr:MULTISPECIES: putative N-acetylmannosamine-6-phosphate 2-epimerase [unclassified Martelella]